MSGESSADRVREILEAALNTTLASDADPSRAELENWDSLTHLQVVFMLEDSYGTRFSAEEIVAMDSLSAIVRVLRDKDVG